MFKKLMIAILLFSASQIYSQADNPKFKSYLQTFRDCKQKSLKYLDEVKSNYKKNNISFTSDDLSYDAVEMYIKNLDKKSFLQIIHKRNSAHEESVFGPAHFRYDLKNFTYKEIREYSMFEGVLNDKLITYYPIPVAILIMKPIVLKVKIKNISSSTFKLNDRFSSKKMDITVEVEEVLKGKSHTKIGDIIEFYYFPSWMTKGKSFEIGQNYFVALSPVTSEKHIELLALVITDLNDGIVKIKDNLLIDDENYYGYGKIPWDEFKKKLLTVFNLE